MLRLLRLLLLRATTAFLASYPDQMAPFWHDLWPQETDEQRLLYYLSKTRKTKSSRSMFGWTNSGRMISSDLLNISFYRDSVDLSTYVKSGEFDLISTNQLRRVVKYSCCTNLFPDIIFFIHIQRKILFYVYNAVIPCSMLTCLTLLVFWLPPDSGEKITLGVTVLLAFSVFMLNIAERMPETSDSLPLIGCYLILVMGLTSVSVLMTVLVLNCHYRGPLKRRVPPWMQWLVLVKLRSFLGMSFDDSRLVAPSQPGSWRRRRSLRRDSYQPPHPCATPVVFQSGGDEASLVYTSFHGPAMQESLSDCPSDEEARTSPIQRSPPREQRGREGQEELRGGREIRGGLEVRGGHVVRNGAPPPKQKRDATKREVRRVRLASGERSSSGEEEDAGRKLSRRVEGETLRTLNWLRSSISVNRYSMDRALEWRRLAEVLDRLLFWIFLLVTLIVSFLLLILIPVVTRTADINRPFTVTDYGIGLPDKDGHIPD